MASFIRRFFPKKTPIDSPISHQLAEVDDGSDTLKKPEVQKEQGVIFDQVAKRGVDLPQLIVGVAQSVGMQRNHNEDALYSLTTNLATNKKTIYFGLYLVADGMGGHENGEIASSVAVELFTSHVMNTFYVPLLSNEDKKVDLSIQEIMQTGIIHAHQTIKKEVTGSGTTLTAALIMGDQLTIAHVGDSRAYLVNPEGNIQLLTHDHSVVKRLEEIGQISPEQASTHPQRNLLYRAIGQGEQFDPDIASYQLQKGCQIILCTDGLWGVVSEGELKDMILFSADAQQVCQSLVDLANKAGGPDNISVILIRIPD